MKFLVSYYITSNLEATRRHWEKYNIVNPTGVVGTTKVIDKNLDRGGKIKSTITRDFRWIQDAIMLINGNYLVADSNNHRLVEINHLGAIISIFNYSRGYKVFNIREYNTS